ncbi:alpha-ribazole phosphatase [Deminuibacter soli]|uniref:Alpha-ribazole phosphatase n=1 Tax=Deminuibacter soli TaxID=2291815 RepID=A0A3E1NFG5_9BACT|nr:alpha-ribazole phosphatase [Deminuibacter soli]RFM26617.1 alpha-ribazole phosphatase [Deminuibacter soli]
MEIYLIRHTTPDVARGICYGQADIDVTASFAEEAAAMQPHIPAVIETVYSSPLQRCSKLAGALFPEKAIAYTDELKEINCGEWELQQWDAIPRAVLQPWMDDFVNHCIPGGENYVQLYNRVVRLFSAVAAAGKPAALVTHGGVLRSILAHITQTPLKDSFGAFSIHYGCVVRITENDGQFNWEILHNIAPEHRETHKPSGF